jgi:hypothetical protein
MAREPSCYQRTNSCDEADKRYFRLFVANVCERGSDTLTQRPARIETLSKYDVTDGRCSRIILWQAEDNYIDLIIE